LIIRGESVLNIVPVHERIFAMQIVIGINVTSTEIPSNYSLSQNYPNPFNPVTKINFSLPEAAEVTLNVYDIEGKIVKELVKSSLQASSYSVFFDGTDLPSGVYFYKLATRWYTQSKKMIVVK
jgi:hypothetical protein